MFPILVANKIKSTRQTISVLNLHKSDNLLENVVGKSFAYFILSLDHTDEKHSKKENYQKPKKNSVYQQEKSILVT